MTPAHVRNAVRRECRRLRRRIPLPRMFDPLVTHLVEQIEAETEDALGLPVSPLRRFLPHIEWELP